MGLADLPLASGKRHKTVFEGLGWVVQTEGNHIVLTHLNHPQVFLSIPNHAEVKRGTLKSIVRAAGLTDDQYRVFFNGDARHANGIATEEELFREHVEPDGRSRIMCMTCGQPVCHSSDLTEILAAKEAHATQCVGPITA